MQSKQFLLALDLGRKKIESFENYQLGADGIQRVDYADTEYYAATRSVLNNHKKMLAILLDP